MTIETRKGSASSTAKQLVISKDEIREIMETALKEVTKPLLEKIDKLEQEIITLRESHWKPMQSVESDNKLNISNTSIDIAIPTESPVSKSKVPPPRQAKQTYYDNGTPYKSHSSSGGNAYKRRSDPKVIKGNSIGQTGTELQAPESKIWLYIGRCNKSTTESNVQNHLRTNWPTQQFDVLKLDSKGTNSAFRISCAHNETLRSQLYDPSKWPKGIVVKQFRFFRRNNNPSAFH